eukprot:CAMPEP_0113897550 /NCGR_PEP_ID=MMETSP0780_2-20120614/18766_1 /TAXON_ID=652834 /ORGANISM="Palpitomonas bilix" /LENGTH=49 /DNA_ID=CAMNT_0000889075 /DNA_START=342 /DNA_END=491 /DNA_ORIENTATION=+ /assembly_acc=CAM_ASM_000599
MTTSEMERKDTAPHVLALEKQHGARLQLQHLQLTAQDLKNNFEKRESFL